MSRLPAGGVRDRLVRAFAWRTDGGTWSMFADITGWWRDPALLVELGPALAGLYEEKPTVVVGPVSRGSLLGALTASALGVGFVEIRKNPGQAMPSDRWVVRTTGPDYRDRHVEFGFRHDLIDSGDRVLMVDDWADTGATALVTRELIAARGARWIGAACLVDALETAHLRHTLPLRALLTIHQL